MFYRVLFLGVAVLSFAMGGCSGRTELNWHEEEGYRWTELSPAYFGSAGFEQLNAPSTRVQFGNHIKKESVSGNRHYLNGSGVAAADVDGDGWVDLYFAGLDVPNKLYKNRGDLSFEDITEEAGVAHKDYNSTGVVFADVDGDGDPDLLVSSLTKQNELYINDGEGHFELKENSGLGPSKGSNTMALADIDGDGDLDLYISNYKLKTVRDIYGAEELTMQNTVSRQGDSLLVKSPFDRYYGIIQTDTRPYRLEYGAEDELYLNNGDGTFEEIDDPEQRFRSPEGGPGGLPRDWGLTAKFQDLNGDMLPDLYVANDFWTPDRLWVNRGSGSFQAIGRNAIRNLSYSSMGVDFSDINRDGSVDIFVTEMLSDYHPRKMRQFSEHLEALDGRPQYNRNSLYLNRGDDTFAEISYFSNLEASEWSWATVFLDVDLDGFEDLVITTGHAYDYQDLDTQMEMSRQSAQNMKATGDLFRYPELKLGNKVYKNHGDLTFGEMSSEWGFTEQDISLGLAVADLDNDGDPDLAINRLNQQASLYRNTTNAPRIAVRLDGKPPNTAGIGAKVELKGGSVVQTKEISAGGSYASGSQPIAFFAADKKHADYGLTVTWPNGETSSVEGVKANRLYVIEQDTVTSEPDLPGEKEGASGAAVRLFEDVSVRINHSHHEDPYTDTNVQALLPAKVSERGPGLSWIDYDRDGDDDLFISSGKGAELALYENLGEGAFRRIRPDGLRRDAPGDQTTVLGWASGNATDLLVGSANFEQGDPGAPSAYHYRVGNTRKAEETAIPGIYSTTGPLAAADYDSDGDVDLFVGGSFNPARYPQDATSRLFKNENGRFVPDRVNSRKLSGVGLVSGAVFTDYDRDGDQDLLVSREWDTILQFENRRGVFREISAGSGLDAYYGWWNGIATGDFNNDGRPDLVATNIGENSVYQMESDSALKLFFDDFNGDRRLDIVDAYFDPAVGGYVPRRKLYEFDSVPTVLKYVDSHRAFAGATVDEIFGRDFDGIPSKKINTLQHMLFINTGRGFEARPLPDEAQFSAAFHAGVADFNSDGNEDLFLSQNMFPLPSHIPRLDAGQGLLLKGDGSGSFTVVPGHESGILIYGEQRGASVSDFNRDGKPDLAVSQNQGETRLFLNRGNRRGIRIRLQGTAENRDAIGSAVRLVYKSGAKGPLRELQAGSGYWSQHSVVPVLGLIPDRVPVAVEIHWFNGTSEMARLTENRFDYTLKIDTNSNE